MKKNIPLVLAVFVVYVFVQSLFFKFTGSQETVIYFATVGQWMSEVPLFVPVAEGFKNYGSVLTGIVELVASVIILIPGTRGWGALTGLGAMSGAIFFHLATPLGVNRVIDAAGNTDDGVLFFMACGVWLSCAALIYMNRHQLSLLARLF